MRLVFYVLSEFLTKDVLEYIVNPTYLVGCCDCTLINLVCKTIVLIFNTTHKMGCCEYWTDRGDIIYDTWKLDLSTIHFLDNVAVHSRLLCNQPFFFLEKYAPTTTFALIFVFFIILFLYFVFAIYIMNVLSNIWYLQQEKIEIY